MRLAFPALLAFLLSAALDTGLLDKSNLVAWCVVPFDARQRGPEERAAMLAKLGVKRLAYDWREQHIPQFDAEVEALRRHGVRLEAFWATVSETPERNKHLPIIFDLLQRRKLSPQIWLMFTPGRDFEALPQEEKIRRATAAIRPVASEAMKVKSKVALYNHGGWFGEPENQIEIIRGLGMENVGIVYNFHHGRPHMDRFPALLETMKPHLLAINLNGMKEGGPQILPIGEGNREEQMIRTLAASGWRGPVGILNHQEDVDAEVALRRNLEGLDRIRRKLEGRQ